MRKYHRWLSVLFGAFLLWIAATGVLIQAVPLLGAGGGERPKGNSTEMAQTGAPAGFVCPETLTCRPKSRGKSGNLKSFLQHLHSGETFGPVGTVISILAGLALVFFAFSGLWVYVQMWRNRRSRGITPGWFWG
jgi:uncharacterized iron-regulated membrane protein